MVLKNRDRRNLANQPFTITKLVLQRLYEHVRSQEYEVCGFLAGSDAWLASRLYPVENIARRPYTEFYMEPHQQYQAHVDIEERGLEVTGIYHSHPAGAQSGLSSSDVKGAWGYSHVAHVVVSRSDENSQELQTRVFAFVDAEAIELVVNIVD